MFLNKSKSEGGDEKKKDDSGKPDSAAGPEHGGSRATSPGGGLSSILSSAGSRHEETEKARMPEGLEPHQSGAESKSGTTPDAPPESRPSGIPARPQPARFPPGLAAGSTKTETGRADPAQKAGAEQKASTGSQTMTDTQSKSSASSSNSSSSSSSAAGRSHHVSSHSMEGERKRLVVGKEISLSGEISACDHLVVQGEVEAKLKGARSIEIADGGAFRGKVKIESAEISGVFEGELHVEGRLSIRSTGIVKGKITCGDLSVDLGGKLVGDIAVGDETPLQAGASTRKKSAKTDDSQMSLTA